MALSSATMTSPLWDWQRLPEAFCPGRCFTLLAGHAHG